MSGETGEMLAAIVAAINGDPAFRALLAADPAAAFRAYGLAVPPDCPALTAQPGAGPVSLATTQVVPAHAGRQRAESTEMLLLAIGARPLLLVHLPVPDAPALAAWAHDLGFHVLGAPFEFVPVADTGKNGYSNLAGVQRPAAGDPRAWRGVLVSPSRHQLLLAWLALHQGWDELLGLLLGYPPCCTRAFAERWPVATAVAGGDPGVMLARASACDGIAGPFDARLNIFARYFGFELIQHFPCRFDCAATAAMARAQLALMAAHDEPRARQLARHLRAPTFVSDDGTVALFPGGLIDGPSIAYDSANIVGGSTLAPALHGAKLLRRGRRGHWTAGDTELAGVLVQFTADADLEGMAA